MTARASGMPRGLLRQDIGVALVVLVALALGVLLRQQVESATVTFRDGESAFRLAYPASWNDTTPPAGVLLRAEDPRADSAFKTTLTVERRDLDPAAPPTVQELVDRRIAQHGGLTAHALLATTDATVDGAGGARIEYAYVVRPTGGAQRQAVPVVALAREYVVVTAEGVYYIALAAPEGEAPGAFARFDRIIGEVRVR